jgi:C-terminal processing protease CtpA/Prc
MRPTKYVLLFVLLIVSVLTAFAIGEDTGTPTPATPAPTTETYTAIISPDEGGVVRVTGVLPITNVNVKKSSMRPVVILEDQGNFVTRDILAPIPESSQVLARFTTDFYADAPVGYELLLPSVPEGRFNDVDNNGQSDEGIQIYQVGYWEDRFGAIYLNDKDVYGWSSAYSSARVDEDPRQLGEIIGGNLIVYAASTGQGMSSGFGADGKLFTADDPIVTLPTGWTLVNMDTETFTFSRSRSVEVNLIEPDSLVLDDFSDLSYTEAFDALIEKGKNEYSFTEFKGVDWDALSAEFRPLIESAEQRNNLQAYLDAIDALAASIPDGHVNAYGPRELRDNRRAAIQGSIGVNFRELTDGRILINYVGEDTPAERAGIEVGAEVIAINGTPIDEYISGVLPFTAPFSNDEQLRLAQVLFASRFPLGDTVTLTYRNPDDGRDTTVDLSTIQEFDSLSFGESIQTGSYGDSPFENPVEYEFTEDGIGIIEVNTFDGYENLIVENWTFFINTANEIQAPAIIIDLRTNGGGFSSIGNRLAAMLYTEDVDLYLTESYAKELNAFYNDPRFIDKIKIDPDAPHYDGEVVVLVGPSCASACEFFAYALTRNDRAIVMGQYGSYAIGGGWSPTYLPEDVTFALPTNRKIAPDGSIVVEGSGIQPDVRVPVDESNFASTEDVVLQAALDYLNNQ